MKILQAYCKELEQEFDIDELHSESMKENGKKFSLYCSDSKCLANRVEIIGVNYHKPKSEQKNIMHFRENKSFAHSDDCKWKIFSQNVLTTEQYADENDEQYSLRQKCHSDLDDWITKYNPRIEKSDDMSVIQERREQKKKQMQQSDLASIESKPNSVYEIGRETSSFIALCRHHYKIYNNPKIKSKTELRHLPLEVTSLLDIRSYYDYFTPVDFCFIATDRFVEVDGEQIPIPELNGEKHIMFSEVKNENIKRYGDGFGLIFWLKVKKDEKAISFRASLYVSKADIQQYRNKNLLLDIVDNLDKYEKLFVYLNIADLQANHNGRKSIDLEIKNLKNLVFVGSAKSDGEDCSNED